MNRIVETCGHAGSEVVPTKAPADCNAIPEKRYDNASFKDPDVTQAALLDTCADDHVALLKAEAEGITEERAMRLVYTAQDLLQKEQDLLGNLIKRLDGCVAVAPLRSYDLIVYFQRKQLAAQKGYGALLEFQISVAMRRKLRERP